MTDRIGVVGAGTMGRGVAQLFASGGHAVVLVDVSADALELARTEIGRNVRLAPLVGSALRAGRMKPPEDAPPATVDEVMDRITFTTDAKELRMAGFVVENVTERWQTKREVYREIDEICPPRTLFGVNTSAIPITRVASVTGRPAQVIGTHFMNPAQLKPTVEVIRGFHTADATVEATRTLLASVGRESIVVRDSPGFVTNRVFMLTVNEAIFLLHEGVAGAVEIDRLFKECLGHPMGPLETADLIGLDTVLLSLEVLYDHLNEPKYRPCPRLRTMVDAGLLGRKSGRGFHDYETQEVLS